MAKRLVDGDRLWRSDKLKQVPAPFRAEYANLLPLALADGTFECSPEKVWSDVYSYNRSDVNFETVVQLLDELEKAKLLFRWVADDEKTWGYWVGMRENGLLPTKKSVKQARYKLGKAVPKNALKLFLNNKMAGSDLQLATTCSNL